MMLLGTIILWVGWYGFNPGSTLCITGTCGSLAGKVAVTTTISPAFAALTMVAYQCAMGIPYDIGLVINAVLAGLVSITAPCAVVDLWAAMLIGIIGCFVFLAFSKMLVKLQVCIYTYSIQ
jgi:Amt family ammonium transporter